ncbi:helix-turn-helix domain-containing protein [Actinophytocola sediminis]
MTAANPDVAALLAQVVQLLASTEPTSVPVPRMSETESVMLTVEEAAERLRIGRTTAWSLVKSGELRSVSIGRLRRVPASEVQAYAAQLMTNEGNTDEPRGS